MNTARQLQESGQIQEAEKAYATVLDHAPDNVDALFQLGLIAYQSSRFKYAMSLLEKLISYRGSANDYFLLGLVSAAQNNSQEAIRCYKHALILTPDHIPSRLNLGMAYQRQYNPEAAIKCYQEVLVTRPGDLTALINLGRVYKNLGRFSEAEQSFRTAIQVKPDLISSHTSLGAILWEMQRCEEAIEVFKEATDLDPVNCQAWKDLGTAYYGVGNIAKAREYFKKIIQLSRADGIKIHLAGLMPRVTASITEIDSARECMDREMDALLNSELHVEDALSEIGSTNFLLAYHGQDDKLLQMKYARLCEHACSSLVYTAPHCLEKRRITKDRKISIGFISKYFYNHSIGKTSRGIIANLSREHFHVIVIFLTPPSDEIGRFIEQHADQIVILPNNLAAARQCISEQSLDILFYQDTGMEPFTFFLAFSRLAPVQCTSFGHPVTTGIPNLDYYISTEDWEPANADDHYSEKLVRLRNVASVAYYYKPNIPDPLKPRSYFGLDDKHHLYICPQTLFKFHPDFDALIAGILRADADGRLIIIEAEIPNWGKLLRHRFGETIPDVADRIQFLPRQPTMDFINIIAISDVMLDTIHFCGFNTTLQGFAVGTPVVTLPGEFMRSRHTYASYKKMEVMDCVAKSGADYIDIAVRLGIDSRYRSLISKKITAHLGVLWEDAEVVREFERFFLKAVDSPG